MASRRRRRAESDGASADTNVTASPDLGLLAPLPIPSLSPLPELTDLLDNNILDERLFNFGVSDVGHGFEVGKVRESQKEVRALSPSVAFRDARTVGICVRRKERREVLHALRRRGRGSGRRNRTWKSEVKC